MRLPKIPVPHLPKIPLPWLGVGLLVLAGIILHQIPHKMAVTLHLLTERLSFVLSEAHTPVPLLEGQPLTSLTLQGVARLPLHVQELRQGGRLFAPPGGRIVLESRHKNVSLSSLTFAGDGLRLIRLALAPRAQVTLYTDVAHHALLDVQMSALSQLELGVAERFTLTVQGMTVQDEQGKEVLPPSPGALQVTPVRRNLLFDQTEQLPTGLMVLGFSRHLEPGSDWKLPLALIPGLQVFSLDVTREDRGKRVSAVQQLWIEPQVVPEEKKAPKVFLQVREHEVFTLHSVTLSKDGLECELSGRTATIMVGKEMPPTTNVVPSWLEYIVKHVIFQTACKPLGAC